MATAEAVARKLVRSLQKGNFEVLCNAESRAISWIKGIYPRLYLGKLASHCPQEQEEEHIRELKNG